MVEGWICVRSRGPGVKKHPKQQEGDGDGLAPISDRTMSFWFVFFFGFSQSGNTSAGPASAICAC